MVEGYLKELEVKIALFGILFLDDSNKNQQTLYDLEISPDECKEFICSLQPENYSENPLDEKMHSIKNG